MTVINNRNQIITILPEDSIGCELGVFEGEYSEVLAGSGKFQQLFLVDTFNGYASNFGKTYNDASVLENIVKTKFHNNECVKIIKAESLSFLQSMSENFFDFIYIDTVHDYDYSYLELEASYKVIKNKGFICGHDFTNIYFPDLVKAVQKFVKKYAFDLIITSDIEDYPSFIIQVNKI